MQLQPVNPNDPEHIEILYQLMIERPEYARISSVENPTIADHEAYVKRHPYRYWYMVKASKLNVPGAPFLNWGTVGSIYATMNNEIGISILERFQGLGLGPQALAMFISSHAPLGHIPGQRAAQWLANINPHNPRSQKMFQNAGFTLLQYTYALPSTRGEDHDATD